MATNDRIEALTAKIMATSDRIVTTTARTMTTNARIAEIKRLTEILVDLFENIHRENGAL